MGFIFRQSKALDIASVRQGENRKFFLDQIFIFQIFYHVLNFGFPVVTEFVADGYQLFFQNRLDFFRICKKVFVVVDFLFQFSVLIFEFFPVEPLQLDQAHIADILSLIIIQLKPFHQTLLGIVVAGADDMDHFIDIVLRNKQAFE